jgi:type III restriction enzyme
MASQLEMLTHAGFVAYYVCNDRLEFTIPYEFYGYPQVYEPNFIVRLTNGLHLVLEVKGMRRDDTNAKHQAAERWIKAVNNWGKLGKWQFVVCWDPQALGPAIRNFA